MSFLAPLFLVGALAVALPILFHLIRRTSREKTVFSSLMFLLPTPPRVTKRSRLENLFLLLLRCLVLCLLALGFARPFFPNAVSDARLSSPGKRVVILLDTSASMRRGSLWPDAVAKANEVLRRANLADQVAVFTFDRNVNRLVTFEQWTQTAAGERAGVASQRLAQTAPGWFGTQLGQALISAAEALEESRSEDKQPAPGARQIVLISDLQEGSRLDTLQAYEWPKDIELIVEPVKSKRPTNAGLQLVADADDGEKKSAESGPRVRVSNSSDAKREQFKVGWAAADGKDFAGATIDVYVPPGQSRVVSAPPAPAGFAADKLLLQGDDEDFDNTVFVVAPEAARVNILYLGNDAEKDTAAPLFFLQRAFPPTRRQTVQVIARAAGAALLPTDTENLAAVVLTDALPDERLAPVRRLLSEGKTVLFALKDAAAAQTLAKLLNLDSLAASEATSGGYAMFAEIDFQHPLFAPFADPRFSDFTKIHFWKHRRLDATKLPGARVLARFDDGDPAWLEVPVGKGKLSVLTAGWQPADSQLALSSKFVPLLYSLLEQGGGFNPPPTQYLVGDALSFSNAVTGALTIRQPDGTQAELARDAAFTPDQPGIYTIASAQPPRRFAVNLSAEESRTAPMPVEELERLGLSLKRAEPNVGKQAEAKRHLLNTELENRQKLWRWLVVAALAVLLVETWLAGWLTRRVAVEAV